MVQFHSKRIPAIAPASWLLLFIQSIQESAPKAVRSLTALRCADGRFPVVGGPADGGDQSGDIQIAG
jgi:hypothetical protein